MGLKKISELGDATLPLGGTEQVPLVQAGVTVKATEDDLGSVTATGAQTLTNKRITPRVGTVTSSATPTINTDNVDVFNITALAVAITSMTTNLSGTPTEGQYLQINITGTAARAITWGASFEDSAIALPLTTVLTAMLSVFLRWNSVTSKWRCMGATVASAVTAPFLGNGGTASAPDFTFTGDLDTGIYSSGADTINAATGGTLRLTLSTTDFRSTLPVLIPDGSTSNPGLAFAGDINTGLLRDGGDLWGFVAGGVRSLQVGASYVYVVTSLQAPATITAAGTTGARTIDKMSGSVNFAAAATSLVVTNSLVTTNSIIIATVATNDATMQGVQAVAAAGSFTLYAQGVVAAETRVNFLVINKGD